MPSYELSGAADADLEAIGRHSAEKWGFERAEAYLLALHRAFENLTLFPKSGRRADEIRRGYFRFESERHVVFYRKTDTGILIVRVLHQRMEAKRHLSGL